MPCRGGNTFEENSMSCSKLMTTLSWWMDGWRTSVRIGHCVNHCLCTDLGPYDSIRSMHLQSRRNKRSIHHWWCVGSVRAMTARRHSEYIVQPTHAQLARGTHSQTTKRYADAQMQRGFRSCRHATVAENQPTHACAHPHSSSWVLSHNVTHLQFVGHPNRALQMPTCLSPRVVGAQHSGGWKLSI